MKWRQPPKDPDSLLPTEVKRMPRRRGLTCHHTYLDKKQGWRSPAVFPSKRRKLPLRINSQTLSREIGTCRTWASTIVFLNQQKSPPKKQERPRQALYESIGKANRLETGRRLSKCWCQSHHGRQDQLSSTKRFAKVPGFIPARLASIPALSRVCLKRSA